MDGDIKIIICYSKFIETKWKKFKFSNDVLCKPVAFILPKLLKHKIVLGLLVYLLYICMYNNQNEILTKQYLPVLPVM